QRHRRRDAQAGGDDPGPAEDKRYPQRLVVELKTVVDLAVLQKLLAVVGQKDDEGRVTEAETGQVCEQIAHLVVGVPDLLLIEQPVALVLVAERFGLVEVGAICRRWRVRKVGLVGMEEEEEGLLVVTVEPCLAAAEGLLDLSLGLIEARALV